MELNLQLFNEGATGEGTAVPAANGENTQNEQAADAQVQAEERKKAYESFKQEYKTEFDGEVQSIIKDRLKSSKAKTADLDKRLKSLSPILERLAGKYNVDPTDTEALIKAYEDDDANFEEEAYSRGMTVEQLKYERQLDRRKAELDAAEEEERRNKQYAIWDAQVAETLRYYPEFSIDTEMQNPDFTRLMNSGVPIKTAFEVVHNQEMMQGAMKFAAQRAATEVTNNVKSNLSRPIENGASARAASTGEKNYSAMSFDQLEEIARRVKAGEQI